MRFLMLMIPKGYESAAPGTVPDAKAVAAMMKYNESLQKAGVLLRPKACTRRRWARASRSPAASPRSPTGRSPRRRRSSAGYWMIDVKSKEEAVQWASRCPASENEIIEVRQVQEMEDFPADVQAAAEGFQEMQAKAGKSTKS